MKALVWGSACVPLMLLLLVVVPFISQSAAACSPAGGTLSVVDAAGTQPVGKWSAPQVAIAATIVETGQQLGVPARAQLIAVMTAMGESSLTNVDHGDAARNDTIGVFQEGPENGTTAQRMDPAQAAKNFYQRLLAVTGWQTMTPTLAAHAAQHNADPNYYTPFWADAQLVVAAVTGANTGSASSVPSAAPRAAASVAPAAFIAAKKPSKPKASASASPTAASGAGSPTPVASSSGGATFGVGELNVLGADRTHCRAGNDVCQYPAWPAVEQRSADQAAAIAASGVSVVTLQEVQPAGVKTLAASLGAGWTIYGQPTNTNDAAVAWRNDTWTPVSKGSIPTPWYQGSTNNLPWVLLQAPATGQQVIVMSAHTVALHVYGATLADQHRAFDVLAAAWKTLASKAPGVPIILGGDFNNPALPCYFDAIADAVDSAGAQGTEASCSIPRTHLDPTEWTVSTRDVAWNGFVDDNSLNGNVAGSKQATDHDFDHAMASIGAGQLLGVSAGAFGCNSGTAGPGTPMAINAAVSYVGGYTPAQLMQRAQAYAAAKSYDPFYNSVTGGWHHKCQHFASNLSGRSSSGYGSAMDAWTAFTAAGTAHPANAVDGRAPPPGAWLYYSGSDTAGHVDVYLGNGLIASTDVFADGTVGIGPASAITDGPWHETYLGWAAPWGAPVPVAAPAAAPAAAAVTTGAAA